MVAVVPQNLPSQFSRPFLQGFSRFKLEQVHWDFPVPKLKGNCQKGRKQIKITFWQIWRKTCLLRFYILRLTLGLLRFLKVAASVPLSPGHVTSCCRFRLCLLLPACLQSKAMTYWSHVPPARQVFVWALTFCVPGWKLQLSKSLLRMQLGLHPSFWARASFECNLGIPFDSEARNFPHAKRQWLPLCLFRSTCFDWATLLPSNTDFRLGNMFASTQVSIGQYASFEHELSIGQYASFEHELSIGQ